MVIPIYYAVYTGHKKTPNQSLIRGVPFSTYRKASFSTGIPNP